MPHDQLRKIVGLAGALLMTGCAVDPAASEPQQHRLSVDQVAGLWALTEVEGQGRCEISLANLIIDGVRPVLAERCNLSGVLGAKSWRATAIGFELLTGEGDVIMAFRRTGEDAFEEVDRRYRMTRAPIS